MSYRRRAGGGKRDSVEAEIVKQLRKCGVEVWHLGGNGNPDILCKLGTIFLPLEVKGEKGKLTKNQQAIPWPVVTTFDEAWLALSSALRPGREDERKWRKAFVSSVATCGAFASGRGCS